MANSIGIRRQLALTTLCILLAGASAHAQELRYQHSSKLDPADTTGAVNHITAANTADASKLVTTGKTYALGMISSGDTPAWGAREFKVEVVGMSLSPTSKTISAHDDRWLTHVGIGSQIDGLGHLGIDGKFYGGLEAKDFYSESGLTRLGTEHIPPIATRGVLLDVAAHLGVKRLAASQPIDAELLQEVARKQGVIIRKGDVVLVHTGWMSMVEEDAEQFLTVQPGIDLSAARYLAELGVVAVGADSAALEVQPSTVASHPYPVHGLLLANYGVYILENMVTRELAADGAHEFMFVLGQPRLAGSVQAIINPVAIR